MCSEGVLSFAQSRGVYGGHATRQPGTSGLGAIVIEAYRAGECSAESETGRHLDPQNYDLTEERIGGRDLQLNGRSVRVHQNARPNRRFRAGQIDSAIVVEVRGTDAAHGRSKLHRPKQSSVASAGVKRKQFKEAFHVRVSASLVEDRNIVQSVPIEISDTEFGKILQQLKGVSGQQRSVALSREYLEHSMGDSLAVATPLFSRAGYDAKIAIACESAHCD